MPYLRIPGRCEADRVAVERVRQRRVQVGIDLLDDVGWQKKIQPQPPIVVPRHEIVEPENVGPAAKPTSRMGQARPPSGNSRKNNHVVVEPRQCSPGNIHASILSGHRRGALSVLAPTLDAFGGGRPH